ncbi:hypothetical protein ACLKA7_004255 [Drosophila subpalustris]
MCKCIGSALCCCVECGLKILLMLIFSIVGILIIVALAVYFLFFYEDTRIDLSNKFKDMAQEIYINRFMNS